MAIPGVCEGQLQDVALFNAVSGRQTANSLEQVIAVLMALDQKLALSNDQLNRLIELTGSVQAAVGQQVSESLEEVISRRLNALPAEILANTAFREELSKMKEAILKEVEARYPTPPTLPGR
ncbi:MAG: hypothetical protein HGA78_09065 [Nitrospirales bacterium]|nr:hypothetical protein [Nitrospirales bacterium]